MSLVIAMSVYKVRPGTRRSVDELLRTARNNPQIVVVIFNKTGLQLTNESVPANLRLVTVEPETFGETISRLEVKDEDTVIWCNDDDLFEFTENLLPLASRLGGKKVGLPVMSIETSSKTIDIDWGALSTASSISGRYQAYVQAAAPLIFVAIPGEIFNSWINYVKQTFVKFPYLDTQLNLACLTASSFEITTDYAYVYGAFNWESTQKMHETTETWVKQLGLNDDAVYTLDMCRAIDDIVFVSQIPNLESKIKREFLDVLFDHLSFMNQSHRTTLALRLRGRVFVSLFDSQPLPIKRILIQIYQYYYFRHESKHRGLARYRRKLPRNVSDKLLGGQRISSVEEFQSFLQIDGLHQYLSIPYEQVRFWRKVFSAESING
jgi:hypothetical protein